ncbi:MAG: amino acid transporter, partial [Candidatus Omnitrophica bacterium]|nr:amino acid transporter [Candidatus Omnitrophota bacterium]
MIGGQRNISDPRLFHNISLVVFFAWVGLGADGLSSSCYGPQEAFLALKTHAALGIFVALATAITIFVISSSYSQIIELFPHGG